MAFVITTARLNEATGRSFYSSNAGIFNNQITHHGDEEKSSLIRAFLLATLDGLAKIENLDGRGKGTVVELLIPDEQVAARMRDATPSTFSKILHFDDEELWKLFLQRKLDFDLRIFSHPDEGDEVLRLWKWQRPEPARWQRTESDRPSFSTSWVTK